MFHFDGTPTELRQLVEQLKSKTSDRIGKHIPSSLIYIGGRVVLDSFRPVRFAYYLKKRRSKWLRQLDLPIDLPIQN